MSHWLSTTNANRLRQSYLNGFLDISGHFTLRNGSSTIFNDLNLQTYNKNNFDSSFANVWNNYLNSNPLTWQNISISATGQYQVAVQRSYSESNINGNIWISNNYGIQNSWIDTNRNTIQATSSKFQNIVISENGQYITAISNPIGSTVGNNIYRSSDFGQTWTTGQTVLLPGEKMITVAISATGQYQTIITETSNPTTGKIWISRDYGANWSNNRAIMNGISSLAISADGQYQILCQKGESAGNSLGNIFYSSTYGTTWINSNFQISNFPSFNFDLNQTIAISYDGKYQTVLSLGQSTSTNNLGNIFINDNYGVGSSWKNSGFRAPNNTYLRSVSLSGSGKYQIVSTMSDTNTGILLLSKNYGETWIPISPNPIPSSPNFSFVQSLSMSANADYITGIMRVYNGGITAQGNIITSSIPSAYKSMFSLNYFGSDNKGNVLSNHPFNISLPNLSNSGIYLGYDIISDGTYINSLSDNGSKNLLLQTQGGKIGIGNSVPEYTLDISGTCNTTNLNVVNNINTGNVVINSVLPSVSATTGALIVSGGVGISGDVNTNGILNIRNGTASVSSISGALVVSGGVGISGNVNTNGILNIRNGTASESTMTGAFIVSGGVGISGNVNTNNIIVNSNLPSTSSTTGALIVSGGVGISGNVNTAGILNANNVIINSNVPSTSFTNGALVVSGGVGISGNVNTTGILNANNVIINSNVPSTSFTNGALVVSGGVGISGNVNTAGNLNANNIIINSNILSTSFTNGALVVSGGVGISGNVNTASNLNANNVIINSNVPSTSFTNGALVVSGGVGISGNVNTASNLNANNVIINSNVPSTSFTNGALVVSGGVGISGNVNIGGNSTTNNIFTNSISSIGVSLTINGNVTAPTMVYTDNSTRIATTQYVTTAITNMNDYDSGYAGGGGNMFNRFYFANFTSRNTFTDSRSGISITSNYCNSIAISNLNFIYAAVNNTNTNITYYYRSIDSGNTWLDMNVNISSSNIFSSDKGLLTCSQDGKNVFISLNNRIKYSTNYGVTFTDYFLYTSVNPNSNNVNVSIPACSYNGKYVFTIYSPTTSNTIPYYAIDSCYNIFYPSTLINDSWPSILLNQTCDAAGKNVYTVGGNSTSINRIFKSQNYGVTFNRIQNNFPFSISSIKCNKDGEIVYLSCGGYGTTIATSSGGPIYRSFDGGATFTIISPQNSNWSQVTCNNDGNMVIASAYGGNIQFSYNYGVNWNTISFTNNWSAIGSSPVGDLIIGGDFFTTQNFRITTFLPTAVNIGNMNISDTTASTTTTNGALIVSGGMGISGNVNIGNSVAIGRSSAPLFPLDVSGDINFTGTFRQNGNIMTLPAAADTLVGRNTTDTLINKTLNNCDATTQAADNNSTRIATTAFVKAEVATRVSSQWTTIGSNLFYANSVAIGRSSAPLFPLDVSGDINFTGTFRQNGNIMTLPAAADTLVGRNTTDTLINKTLNNCDATTQAADNNSTRIATTAFVKAEVATRVSSQWTTIGSNLFYANSVAIGRSSAPLFPLDVSGDINFTGTFRQNGNPYIGSQWTTAASNIHFATGNVGIGTSTFTANVRLEVNGNVRATSYNATSDYRLKSNIQPISKTIDYLKAIEYDLSGGTHSIGFLAHEVQEHFPFLVSGEKDGKEMQSINYNGFIGLLVKEIQDLKSTVKTLQHRIEILESK